MAVRLYRERFPESTRISVNVVRSARDTGCLRNNEEDIPVPPKMADIKRKFLEIVENEPTRFITDQNRSATR